jgi:threonine dehydrogenase-like Zn-dependent dehydrogenase
VGLAFVKCLSLLGAHPVIALDIIEEKLEDARKNGADAVFSSKDPDCERKVRELCPEGARFVVDAVGVSDIINAAMPLLCDQGKICCYGISANLSMHIDWSRAPYNWQLQFQQFPSKAEEGAAHNQVLNWLKAGAVRLKDYISDVFEFKDILIAFDKLEKKQIAKKCIIRY